jgi:hypothetical protein
MGVLNRLKKLNPLTRKNKVNLKTNKNRNINKSNKNNKTVPMYNNPVYNKNSHFTGPSKNNTKKKRNPKNNLPEISNNCNDNELPNLCKINNIKIFDYLTITFLKDNVSEYIKKNIIKHIYDYNNSLKFMTSLKKVDITYIVKYLYYKLNNYSDISSLFSSHKMNYDDKINEILNEKFLNINELYNNLKKQYPSNTFINNFNISSEQNMTPIQKIDKIRNIYIIINYIIDNKQLKNDLKTYECKNNDNLTHIDLKICKILQQIQEDIDRNIITKNIQNDIKNFMDKFTNIYKTKYNSIINKLVQINKYITIKIDKDNIKKIIGNNHNKQNNDIKTFFEKKEELTNIYNILNDIFYNISEKFIKKKKNILNYYNFITYELIFVTFDEFLNKIISYYETFGSISQEINKYIMEKMKGKIENQYTKLSKEFNTIRNKKQINNNSNNISLLSLCDYYELISKLHVKMLELMDKSSNKINRLNEEISNFKEKIFTSINEKIINEYDNIIKNLNNIKVLLSTNEEKYNGVQEILTGVEIIFNDIKQNTNVKKSNSESAAKDNYIDILFHNVSFLYSLIMYLYNMININNKNDNSTLSNTIAKLIDPIHNLFNIFKNIRSIHNNEYTSNNNNGDYNSIVSNNTYSSISNLKGYNNSTSTPMNLQQPKKSNGNNNAIYTTMELKNTPTNNATTQPQPPHRAPGPPRPSRSALLVSPKPSKQNKSLKKTRQQPQPQRKNTQTGKQKRHHTNSLPPNNEKNATLHQNPEKISSEV